MLRRLPGPLLGGVVVVAVLAVAAVLLTGWRVRMAGTPQALPSGAATTTPIATPSTTSAASPMPAPVPTVPAQVMVDAAIGAMPQGMTLGVAVLDVTTGELAEGGNTQRTFISASLSKLLVVVDMLNRRRTEGLTISESDLELVDRALRASDDGAMNVLWTRYDGHGAVRRVATRLGLSATRPPSDSSQWGDTMVTAGDLTRIYQHILRDMAPEDRDVIVTALATTQLTAHDGFAQHFGLLRQGASEQVYAKQAWVPWRPAGYLLHSAGVAHDTRTDHVYAIALLSIQPSISAAGARDRLSTVAVAALGTIGIT